MVEKRMCNFCGKAIEPGTGKLFVKRDGTVYSLCSNKCKKNQIDLKRVPRRTKWTKRYAELKESALKHERALAEKAEEEKKTAKPKKKKKSKKEPASEEDMDTPVKDSSSETEKIEKKSKGE